MYKMKFSVHNGLCLGIDGSNELAMVNKTSSDNCLWKWQGNVLVNKAGKAMDLECGSKDAGIMFIDIVFGSIPILNRCKSPWLSVSWKT